MRKFLLLFLTALVLLAGFSVVLTARYVSIQSPAMPVPDIAVRAGAAERLSGAIRIPTISAEDAAAFDGEAFEKFHAYLENAFPLVHSRLRREIVGTHSLLYTWQGTDSAANPILLIRKLQENPATNAMVRTTAAPTIFQAGTNDNVLPSHARAAINFRILPGDSVRAVMEHVTRVVDDDRVEIREIGRFSAEPSPVSRTDSNAFRTLERTVRSIVPNAIVAPYLVVVVTDARYYTDISENVYRFLPLRLTSRDLERMHGIDERVGVREYETAIRIYRQLVMDVTRN